MWKLEHKQVPRNCIGYAVRNKNGTTTSPRQRAKHNRMNPWEAATLVEPKRLGTRGRNRPMTNEEDPVRAEKEILQILYSLTKSLGMHH